MPLTESKLFRINVSGDGLTATISLNGDAPPGAITSEQIAQEIRTLGIKISPAGEKNIVQFAEELAQGSIPTPVVVAEGIPPKHDKNGRLEKLFLPAKSEEENKSSQSYYDHSNIITVEKGQELLRIIPPVSGEDGTDVFGKPIRRKLGREATIKLGPNTKLEGDVVVATASGKVECSSDKIRVDSTLEINGSVDFSVGNIDFDGDVVIHKNVLDLFKVHSTSNITVNGVIEAAEVHADQDLYANGGITGKEKGVFSAGRDLHAKYITNARVTAGKNMNVQTEIVNCELICEGKLTIDNGLIIGGRVVSTGGMKVKDLGSEAGVKTLVEVGVDEKLREKLKEVAPEITKRRTKAAKVRTIVEPLLQNQKYLNSEQKEKATELLYTASELDDECNELIADLRQVYEKAGEKAVAEIIVVGKLYSGVTIRFPRVEAKITSVYKGPLKIYPKKEKGIIRILASDLNSGATQALDSGATFDDLWDQLEKLLEPDKQTK